MEPYDPDQGGMATGLVGAFVLWGTVMVLLACCGVVWLVVSR